MAKRNLELVLEEGRRRVEEHLAQAVKAARSGAVTRQELTDMLDILWEEE